jgi:hypothetical protein
MKCHLRGVIGGPAINDISDGNIFQCLFKIINFNIDYFKIYSKQRKESKVKETDN